MKTDQAYIWNTINEQVPLSILLIEDNPADVLYCQALFKKATRQYPSLLSYEMVSVDSLAAAVARLVVEKFDVVLLDLSLPDGQGLENLSKLQTHKQLPPVIILTGQDDVALAIETVQAGAQDYLMKDELTASQLIRTIRHAIERNQLLNELAINERRFRRIIEQNVDGTLVVDEIGRIQYSNPAAQTLFDHSDAILQGRIFKHFSTILEEKTTVIELGSTGAINLSKTVFLEARYVETVWQQKKAYLIVLRDISERKRVEAALAAANHNLEGQVAERTAALSTALARAEEARDQAQAMLEAVADGLIITDRQDSVVMVNQAASQVLQAEVEHIVNRPLNQAIPLQSLREGIKTAITKNGYGYRFDFEAPAERNGHLAKKEQDKRIIQAHASLIHDKNKQHSGTVTVLYDVTKKRQLDRLKNEFIATAAHELRTPLTSIRGFSEILLNRQLETENQQKYLRYINEQAVALAAIVDDLLDIGLVESGQGLHLNKAECDIYHLIERTVNYFVEDSSQHAFELALTELPKVWLLDARKIEQVLKNLLSNAVKYSPHGGLIKVITQSRHNPHNGQDEYIVTIKDQGIGMSVDQIDCMFDKFYRVDASNTATAGIGIGMSIVKEIVQAHHGEIWVESQPGHGTAISFSLVGGCETNTG